MRFLRYFDVLCIQINRFEIKGQAYNVSFVSKFCEFQIKKKIFWSVFDAIIIISDLTINIRSTGVKNGAFQSV